MSGLSEKQLKVMAFGFTDYDVLICDGSVRSGKSSVMSVSFIDWAMRSFNWCSFGICSKTISACKRNIIKPYMRLSWAQQRYHILYRHSDNIMTVSAGKVTNEFYIFGGQDERSQDLIQGITLAGLLLDEVVLMPESFVTQATMRCSVEGSKMWFNCNPDDPKHFILTDWIKKHKEKNALHLHFTMNDNPSLSDKMRQRYDTMYSGVYHDRFIKGLWVRAEGIIFLDFANDPTPWLIDAEKVPEDLQWIEVGLDIGGTASAHAITISGADYTGNIYVLYSKKMDARNTTIDDIERFVDTSVSFVEKTFKQENGYINSDHVDAVINSIKANTRHRIGKAYKPPLEDRPLVISKLLARKRLFFVQGRCDDLVDELRNLVFDTKKEKAIVLDDGTMQVDAWDSLTYSISHAWRNLTDEG